MIPPVFPLANNVKNIARKRFLSTSLYFLANAQCFSIDVACFRNWIRSLTKLMKKNSVYQGHNLKQYQKSFCTSSNKIINFLQKNYLLQEEPNFQSEKCKFSQKFSPKAEIIQFFLEISASRISENGGKDIEKTFDFQTNETAGYQRHILRLPNLVTQYFKKMKTSFPRQKTNTFSSSSFSSFSNVRSFLSFRQKNFILKAAKKIQRNNTI